MNMREILMNGYGKMIMLIFENLEKYELKSAKSH